MIAVAALVAVLSSMSVEAETESLCEARLWETTKVIAVIGDAATNFVPDTDPNTLEIVILNQGKSRVSDDGQVIYLADIADQEEQALLLQAMGIRVKLGFCSRPHR